MLDLPNMNVTIRSQDDTLDIQGTVLDDAVRVVVLATSSEAQWKVASNIDVDRAKMKAWREREDEKRKAAHEAFKASGASLEPSGWDKALPGVFSMLQQVAGQMAEHYAKQNREDCDTCDAQEHFGPVAPHVLAIRKAVKDLRPSTGEFARKLLFEVLPQWYASREKIPAWKHVEAHNWVCLMADLLPDYPEDEITNLCVDVWAIAGEGLPWEKAAAASAPGATPAA